MYELKQMPFAVCYIIFNSVNDWIDMSAMLSGAKLSEEKLVQNFYKIKLYVLNKLETSILMFVTGFIAGCRRMG